MKPAPEGGPPCLHRQRPSIADSRLFLLGASQASMSDLIVYAGADTCSDGARAARGGEAVAIQFALVPDAIWELAEGACAEELCTAGLRLVAVSRMGLGLYTETAEQLILVPWANVQAITLGARKPDEKQRPA